MNAESEMAGADGLGAEKLDPCAQIAESVGYKPNNVEQGVIDYEAGVEELIAYKDALEDAVRQLTTELEVTVK